MDVDVSSPHPPSGTPRTGSSVLLLGGLGRVFVLPAPRVDVDVLLSLLLVFVCLEDVMRELLSPKLVGGEEAALLELLKSKGTFKDRRSSII